MVRQRPAMCRRRQGAQASQHTSKNKQKYSSVDSDHRKSWQAHHQNTLVLVEHVHEEARLLRVNRDGGTVTSQTKRDGKGNRIQRRNTEMTTPAKLNHLRSRSLTNKPKACKPCLGAGEVKLEIFRHAQQRVRCCELLRGLLRRGSESELMRGNSLCHEQKKQH
jgi:hypothetical protein